MRVVSEKTLDLFRGRGECSCCGRWCRRLEPHHWYPKGAGSGARLDIPENLIALGSAFDCACHKKAEDGNVPRSKLLALIALREGKLPEEVLAVIYDMLRRPKA